MLGLSLSFIRNEKLSRHSVCLTSSGSLVKISEFKRIRQEQRLKAALNWNAARFAEEDDWWKESRKRSCEEIFN